MTKKEARILAINKIKKMSEEQKEWASGCIADMLSSLDEFTHSHKIFAYLNSQNEPDTNEIVGLALMMEKLVCVPKVRGDDMMAVCISPYTNFKTNKWGILEPLSNNVVDDIDIAVIPLVAFDGLKRVGHGKGCYDRYLKSHDCLKIGIAYDCQCVSGLDVDEWDVPLDILITEKRVVDINGTKDNVFGVEYESSRR